MPTGYDIINRAGALLNDTAHVRWRCPELCDWINEGVRAIVLAKPSASAKTILLKLAAGTRQTINPLALYPPTTSLYSAGSYPLVLLGVLRNINVSRDAAGVVIVSATTGLPVVSGYGRSIKRADRALLEAQEPNWHNSATAQRKREVRNYTFDEQVPTEFYVYPPNDGGGYVEAHFGVLPQPIKAIIPSPNPNSYTTNSPQVYNQQVGLPEPY